MPAYKDNKKGTWYCKFRYTDWQGNRKETTKRGFQTKREAKEYEQEYIRKAQGNCLYFYCLLFSILSVLYLFLLAKNVPAVKMWSKKKPWQALLQPRLFIKNLQAKPLYHA